MAQIPLGPVIIEGISLCFITFLTILIFQRFFQRKLKVVLLLGFGFFFLCIGFSFSFTGRLSVYLSNQSGIYTHPWTVASLVFTLIAMLFILLFSHYLFFKDKRYLVVLIVIPTGIDFGSLLYQILFYPVYSPGNYGTTFYFYSALYHAFVSILIFLTIFIFAFKSSRTESDLLRRRSAQAIAIYGLLAFLALLVFAWDGYASEDSNKYLFTYYLGWSCILTSQIIAYVGYLQPKWFKNLLLRHAQQ